MGHSIFTIVSEQRMTEVLENLHKFVGLAIQLIDNKGKLISSFGKSTVYCSKLKQRIFNNNECFQLHMKAGQRAQVIGEAYIFACHANLNHIAFPLINSGDLLGSVIVGPFLIDEADSTVVSELADRYKLDPIMCIELYEDLASVSVLSAQRVNQLKKLIDHLLSPMMPGERALLLQNQQKMYQQAKINETIQVYKEQTERSSLNSVYEREKELLAQVRTGNILQVKALLNELLGDVLFSEGGKMEVIRIRAVELTTLLSRVAMDGGANVDSIYDLNSKFLNLLYNEQEFDDLCMELQDIVEGFMSAMFSDKDRGNPHIRSALRFMNDNYSHHLTIPQVAEYVGLSPSYFSSLFSQTVGVSFREYLNRIRIEESKRLLLSTKYDLADIAVAMGFPDQSYYCKVFKKITGLTPGKFRV